MVGMWKSSFKMFKIKSFKKKRSYLLLVFCFFLFCPPLGGNFCRDNLNRSWTFCPLIRGFRYFYPLFRGFLQGICTNFVRSSNFCPLFGGVQYSGCPLIRGFTINFEQISHFFLVFLLFTLSLYLFCWVKTVLIQRVVGGKIEEPGHSSLQMRIQKPVKDLRWSFLWKQLTAESR